MHKKDVSTTSLAEVFSESTWQAFLRQQPGCRLKALTIIHVFVLQATENQCGL